MAKLTNTCIFTYGKRYPSDLATDLYRPPLAVCESAGVSISTDDDLATWLEAQDEAAMIAEQSSFQEWIQSI